VGILGTMIGGTIGFVLGGPLGALLGGAIGSRVEDPTPQQLGVPARGRLYGRCPRCGAPVAIEEGRPLACGRCGADLRARAGDPLEQGTAQTAFMLALISLAARVAKADGHVSEPEIRVFDEFLARDLGMTAEERRTAAGVFNNARDAATPTSAYTAQIRTLFGHRPDRLRDLLALLMRIAWADGRCDPSEEALLREIAGQLGLSARDYEQARALFARYDVGAAYALLEVDRGATEDEIKRSYRRLAKEYHPDTLASRGLSEDFAKFAGQKMQAINDAYAQLRKERGF